MKNKTSIFCFAIALIACLILATTASAVVPENDDFDNAVAIDSVLPQTINTNTAEATTAPDDPSCAGNGHTVWYTYVATEDMRIEFNTFGSNYDTTLSAYVGERGSLTQVACNDDAGSLQSRIRFDMNAGETYYIMVGSWAWTSGGNLVLTVDLAPPPIVTVQINPKGSLENGVATVTGTITCAEPAYVVLNGLLLQNAGRGSIVGSIYQEHYCYGEMPWSMTMKDPYNPFNPANQNTMTLQYYWFCSEYGSEVAQESIKLKRN